MLILLLSMMMHASEPEILNPKAQIVQGHYQAQNSYQILSRRITEDCDLETSEGKNRFQELQKSGYACQNLDHQRFRCSKDEKNTPANPVLDQVVAERWKEKTFSFYSPLAEPILVMNSEFFKQWSLEQKVVLWKVPFLEEETVWNPVGYAWLQGRDQVYLGNSLSGPAFQFDIQDGQLTVFEIVDLGQNLVSDRYLISISFRQVKK